jgi:alpha-L-arabinofuranosidase
MLAYLPLLLTPQTPSATVRVDPQKVGPTVSQSLYGIFFEEINFAGDGGIHAELIRNRGFEEGKVGEAPPFWKATSGSIDLDPTAPFNDGKARSLRVRPGVNGATVENEGFWGVPIKAGKQYRLTVWAKSTKDRTLSVGVVDGKSKPITTFKSITLSDRWQRYEAVITGKENQTQAKFYAMISGNSAPIWLGYASLMPTDGWGTNGLMRPDLGEKVKNMEPGFVRFPGGCYVEGTSLSQAFDWKASLGASETRKGSPQRLWGYSSTDGLGYHEYLQWCEDLGAAPLYVANCGMSHTEIAPMDKMQKYVDDALDAIEYANGPVTSRWGSERAKNGHPKPFNLKYVEIGNENGLSWSFGGRLPYAERYSLIYNAIKAKYPNIITIANDPVPHPMDMVDEHYYNNPTFFWQNANRYDRYDRKGPKIYVGEYAVTAECGKGNLQAALAEAAFMTGMERNSDVVTMASYAPLFVNDNARQWNPDAIVYNNHQSYGTPSYWVQQLFATNRADKVVATEWNVPLKPAQPAGGIGLMTWETSAEFKDIKLTSDDKVLYDSNRQPGSWNNATGKWTVDHGVFRQTELETDRRSYLKDVRVDGLSRYTLRLKARKLSGREGFLILINAQSEANRVQWNLGGWGNSEHGFESGGRISPGIKGQIETGRWYDVRLEVDGATITGYLDDQRIQSVTLKPTPHFAAVSGLSADGKTLIIKAVNGDEKPLDSELSLGNFRGAAEVITLTGPDMLAENSFANPLAIWPKKSKWAGTKYRFQPRSLTILRVSKK